MKKRVFNLIVLDESGSMCSIERQAIDGVNETVQTIRHAGKEHPDQEHYVSLVSFNSGRISTIYDRVEAGKVEELDSNQYCPACATPLYDALGNAITKLRGSVADNDTVLVTVITDGYENSSTEYNAASIKKLVESLKTKGWTFTYIGANQDAKAVADSMSIGNAMNFEASVEGTQAMFATERKARMCFFNRISGKVKDVMNADNYFDE